MDYISRLNDMLKSKHDGKQDESDFMQKLRRQAGYDDSYSKVDQSYVNSFVRDSQGYLSNMQENTKRLSGSNATKEYENYSSRLSDLRSKADNIRSYYNAHKKEMDEQFYQNMIDYLDEFDTSSNTLFDFYRESSEKYNRGSNQKGSEAFDKNNFKNPIDVYQFLSSKDYTNYTDKEIDKEFDEAMFYIGGAKERAEKSAEDVQAVTDPSSVLTGLPRQKRVQEELLNFNNAKPNTVEVENENKNFRDVLNDIQNTKNKNALKNNLSSAVGNIENHKPNQELLSPLEISQNRVNELNDIYQNTLALKNQKKQDKYMTMANEDENFAAYVQEAKTEVDWDQDKISEIKSHPKYQRVYNQVELAFSNRDKNLNLNISDLAPEYLLTMSEDERNTYDYHYITGGKHTADQYLDTIKEELKQRQGKIEAEELLNEKGPIARTAYAGKASIDAAISEIKGIPNALHLSYDPMERTESEYAYQNMRQELSGTEAIISDLVYNTGRMTPSIAASLVNPKLGLAVAGLQSASAAYDSAVSEGYSPNEALAYGTANGISESLSQYLLGGINAFGNSAVGKAIGKTKLTSQLDDITKKLIKNPVARQRLLNIAKYGTEMHSEGMEEYFQEIIDPLVRNITLGEDNELSLVNEDAAYAYLLGALTAGTLNAPYAALNESSLRSEGRKIKSSGEEQQTIQRGLESDQGSKAWELAQEISRKQTNRETPSNYEIGLLENALNEADVQIGPEQTQEVSNEVGNQESYAQTQTRLTEMGVDKQAAAVQAKAIERLKLGDTSAIHTILESPEAKQLLARDTGVVFGTTPEQGRRAAGEIAARAQSQAGRIRQEIQPEQAASTVRQNDQQQTDTSALQPMDHMTERETATAILPAESPASQPQTASAQQGFVTDPVMESGQSAPLKTVSEVRKPQAVWADSGEPVQVTGIQSAQNGELYVRADSDSGSTVVRASDLSYQSPEVELIYQTAAQLGTSGAKAFVYGYQPGSSFDSYYKGFMRAYHAGTANTPFEQIGSAYTAMLPKETARRAYYAGQNDQTERFTNAGERSTIKTKQVKDVTYTYQAVPEGRRSENAGTIVRELELLGLSGEAIEPGLQVRQNGKMRTSQGDASTLKDGHVVVRNDTDANPKNAAAHEAFHAWRNLKLPEANAYFDAVTDGNIDFSSEKFQDFLAEFKEVYFTLETADFEVIESERFREEISAFVSGALYENTPTEIQRYAPMFYDWEMVETAWQKMIEAGKRRKQDDRRRMASEVTQADGSTQWEENRGRSTHAGRGSQTESPMAGNGKIVAEKTGRTPEAERGRPRSIPQVEREGRPGNEGISGQRSLLGLESSEAEGGAGKGRKQDDRQRNVRNDTQRHGSTQWEENRGRSTDAGRGSQAESPMAGNGETVAEGTGRTPEAESGRPRSIPQVEREGRPGNEGIYGQRSLLGLESSEAERGAGKGQQGQTTGLAQNEAAKKLKGSQRAYLHVLGKLSNSRIVLDDTIQGGRANGYYDLDTGEIHIALDAVDSAYDFVAKHELTHQLQQLSPEHYRQYFDHVVSYLNQAEPDAFDKLVQKQLDGYREMGKKITRQQAMDEVVADASDAFLRDSAAIRDLVSQNRTLGQKVLDAIRSMIRKIDQYLRTHKTLHTDVARLLSRNKKALEEAQRLWTNALLSAQKNTAQQKSSTGGDVRFSIRYTTDNTPVVIVEDNILDSIPKSKWVQTVKDTISNKFSTGIPISGRLIKVNSISRSEFTNSKYSKYLKSSDGTIYQDKFRSANNLDDIILASTNYINEDLKHSRNDKFTEFARGDVLIRVGSTDYSAKVIVGFTSGKQMVLYDIINFVPTSLDIKNKDNSIDFGKNRNLRNELSLDTNIPQEDTGVNSIISENDKNVLFSINPNFTREYDAWDKKQVGFSFVVGKTSEALKNVGVKDQTIRWDASKIIKIKNKHSGMTDQVIKQVPRILETPIIVMESKNNASRITVFGEIYDDDQKPVLAVLELSPTSNKGVILDQIKLASAYGKDNIQNFINSSKILYIEPDKKRTDNWLNVNRLQLPLRSTNYGSNNRISYDNDSVNSSISDARDKNTEKHFSLKNVSKLDYDNLIKENKKQKEMISLLEEQFQVTKGIKWDKASIDRTAQRILKQYDSTYSVQDLSENLTSLYGYLKNNPDTNTDEVHSVVTAMSKSVLEHSRKLDDAMYQEYKELRDRIRGTRLTLSDADKADLDRAGGYHQFRRDNFGRLNLTNQGIPVDVFYQELQTLYPEFFAGEEITHPADQLIRIAEVLDTIRPVYVNPYGMNLDEAAGVLANELLESYVDIPQAKPTYADRELQKRKKLKLEYQKKIREIKAEYKAKYEEKLKEVNRQNILNIRKIQEQLKKTAAADRETIKKLERQVERLKKYNQNITHAKTAAMSVSPVTSVSVPVKKSDSSVPMKQVISAAPSYVEAAKQYGTIPKGESPVRDVAVPAQTGENARVRQFARTAIEAGATPDGMILEFEREILNGAFDYNPISDKTAQREAELTLSKKGFDGALKQWKGALKNQKAASKDDIVLAEKLYMQAAKEGNYKLAMELAAEIAEEGTRAGQTVQAMRLLNKMSGEGQLVYIERTVDRMNQDLKSRREKGKAPYLEIPQEMKETLLQSKTREEIDRAAEDIYRQLASRLPVTFADKWNAWRYLSMLGNPRTHVRNLTGNAVFLPAVKMKNLIATGLEHVYRKAGGEIERTKAFRATKESLDFAKKDYEMMADIIAGGGKMNPSDVIRDYQKIFPFKTLEKARKFNFNALEAEDRIFLKRYYVSALAGYMTANQIDPNAFVSQQILERARNYAIQEAQKATYRDASKVAGMLQHLSKTNSALGLLVEGVLPFKKTPVNILKRGVEYSPAGLLYSLTMGAKKVKTGKITAAEYIDSIASGLSGTVLFALGALLQSLGILRGGEDDDKKKEQFDRNMGYQPYSLQIGDISYTIDWLVPSSLPLFVGARVFETLTEEQEDYSVSSFAEDLQMIAEPVLSLSMLSGLNDTLSSVSYGDNGISDIAANVLASYFGQAVPTLFGQAARTVDGTRRTTYTDKNVDIPSDLQYFFQKNQNKIPAASMLSQPYIDLWGREDTQENILIRAFENFVSPGYLNAVETSAVEQELVFIYEETGDAGVFPSKAAKYFQVDGQRKDLTAQEYTMFAKAKGQKAYSLLWEMMAAQAYREASAQEKAELIADVYEYATVFGKTQVSAYSTNGWKAKALQADQNGESVVEVILNRKRG